MREGMWAFHTRIFRASRLARETARACDRDARLSAEQGGNPLDSLDQPIQEIV